jgi:hypothetical protein
MNGRLDFLKFFSGIMIFPLIPAVLHRSQMFLALFFIYMITGSRRKDYLIHFSICWMVASMSLGIGAVISIFCEV